MEMTEQQLAELVTKTVAAAMATSPKPASDPKDAANLSALLDLDGLSEAAKEQRKAELSQMIEASRRQAKIEFEAQLASLAHESKMADLAQKLVTGSDKTPRGFSVPVNDLQAHLMKMSPADAAWWGEFLTNTLEQGFVEFGERGHGRPMQGTQVLPDGIAAALQSWLDAGQKIDEFFRVNAVELGNMSDYNLAAFQPKEK